MRGRGLRAGLLEPPRCYAQDGLAATAALDVHAMAHITGGGLAANLARVLPKHVDAVLERSAWTPQPIFDLIGELGGVARDELERTFNLGVGMVAVVAAADADGALRLLAARTVPAWVIGSILPGSGQARLVSSHPETAP